MGNQNGLKLRVRPIAVNKGEWTGWHSIGAELLCTYAWLTSAVCRLAFSYAGAATP